MSVKELGKQIDQIDEQISKIEDILDLLNQRRKALHKEFMKAWAQEEAE